MKRIRALAARLAGLITRRRREREFSAEVESNLEMHIADNLRAGMPAEQARREAMLKLGGLQQTKEAYRDRITFRGIENFAQDLRFAIRQLARNPIFALTAILVLSLGLGAAIAIFAFVDAALLKPLPYPDPSRLVSVDESTPLFPHADISYPDYLDWKRLNKSFRSMDVYTGAGYLLETPSGSEPIRAARVSDGFFRTLGVAPILGRDFYDGEDLPGKPETVILTYGAWRRLFGGRLDVIGHTVILSGVRSTIVGVLPKTFQFAPRGNAEIWAPLHTFRSCETNRSCHDLDGVGRLKDGISIEAARAEMTSIAKALEQKYPGSNRDQGASVVPLSEVVVGNIRSILLMLLSGVGMLLIIALVNVVSLLLVRSESRRRELAVRSALGGSRMRLFSQFAAEGLLLAAVASALGLVIAHIGIHALLKLIPAQAMAGMPFLVGLGLTWHAAACAGVLALAAALLFSVVPNARLSSTQTREGLGGRGNASTTWRRFGSSLVTIELAIALVLLVSAGLLSKSLFLLLRVNLGFQPDHIATLLVASANRDYPNDAKRVALARQVIDRISSLPGVQSAALTSLLPVNYNGNTDWIRFVGRPYHGEHNEVNERDVSAGYFKTLGAKLLEGRYFIDSEDASKPRVVVINRALAARYFHNENPLGKRIGDDGLSPKSIKEIIGVVDDIREGSLDSDIWPAVYYPFNQSPDTEFSLVVRTAQSPEAALTMLDAAIHKIDRGLGVVDPASMVSQINDSLTAYLHRSSAWLVGGFATLALILSVAGLYGVVAYSVGQRTREIGVRMALGAERRNVYQLILKEAAWLTGAGAIAGAVCSVGAAVLMRKLLFGVSSLDLPTLGIVILLLGTAALLASYFPARRAASVDPAEVLRTD